MLKESNPTSTGDQLPFVLLLTKILFCEIYFLNFCTLKLQLKVAVGPEIQLFFFFLINKPPHNSWQVFI